MENHSAPSAGHINGADVPHLHADSCQLSSLVSLSQNKEATEKKKSVRLGLSLCVIPHLA